VTLFGSMRVKYLAKINVSTLPEDTDPDCEIHYLDISSVGLGQMQNEPEILTFAAAPSRARRLVQDGDTIVSTVRTYLRAVLPIRDPHPSLVVSTGFAVLTPESKIDPRYFAWVIQSDVFIEEVVARSVGVSYPGINASQIGDIQIPITDIQTQCNIANYLDRETARIDSLIEKKQRLVELASELVGSKIESVLSSFVSNCPRPSLAYVLSTPITDGPHETPEFVESGVPFLSVDNIQNSQIDFSETRFISCEENIRFSRKSKPISGDVLVTKAASVGKVALVATDLEFNVWSPIAILRPNREILTSEYLWWLFRSPRIQMQLQLYATSNTQQNISMSDLSSIRLDVPSLDVQVMCVNQLNEVEVWSRNLMGKILKDIDLLVERRKALITSAVTGKLEIPEVAA
jgi:type I restriction enzyme S subunit